MSNHQHSPRDNSALSIAVAVVCWQSRYLVGVRRPDQKLGGLHEFPGGKVRTSETPADAAIRECLEETGIAIRIDGLLQQVEHTYDHGRLSLHFFKAQPLSVDGGTPLPHGNFRWVSRSDLAACRFPEANRAVVSQLLASEV